LTFAGAPLSAIAPALGVGAAALVGLYLLKLRRRRLPVPFARLWARVLKESATTALHRRLRRLLSLLVQLLVLGLILFSLTDPRLGASRKGRSVVFLIDTSASMQARTGGRSRLDEAKAEARRLIRALQADDAAMVVALDGRPAPVGSFTADETELLHDVGALSPTDTAGDLARALDLAADALSGRENPLAILISDGGGEVPRDRPPGIELQYLPVGAPADNFAVTAFSVRRYRANQTAYEVLVEVESQATREKAMRLDLYQGGEVVQSERLTLKPGERVQRSYADLAGEGDLLEAQLASLDAGPLDAFPLDDHAYAVLPERHQEKVLLVSGANLFLEGALLLDQNLTVEKIAPAAYDAAATAKYDAVVFDRFTPDDPPRTHALYLDPRGPSSPFPTRGEIAAPYVTDVRRDHPLMRWVALKDLNIARASRFQLQPGDVAVASSLRDPIIVARQRGSLKWAALGFPLERSDLPMRVAFPVLLINALEWFAGGDAGVVDSLIAGRPLRLRPPHGADAVDTVQVRRLEEPRGAGLAPVHDGRVSYYAEKVGFYELVAGDAVARFAVNLDRSESRLLPQPTLQIGGELPRPSAAAQRVGVRRAIWPLLIWLAFGLVVVEWASYQRRITV
jgi:Mg-chelatase subunit ChlD